MADLRGGSTVGGILIPGLATPAEVLAGTDGTKAVSPAALKTELDKKVNVAGATMAGILTAQTNTSYTTRQVRNIIIATTDPVLANMQNGDIWIKV